MDSNRAYAKSIFGQPPDVSAIWRETLERWLTAIALLTLLAFGYVEHFTAFFE